MASYINGILDDQFWETRARFPNEAKAYWNKVGDPAVRVTPVP